MTDTAPPRHPNSARFHELLERVGETHDLKQVDYGRDDDPFANVRASTEWGVPGWVGAMIRVNDKLRRLQSLRAKGSLANESAEDSLMDIAVYSLIALVLMEQDKAVEPAAEVARGIDLSLSAQREWLPPKTLALPDIYSAKASIDTVHDGGF